MNRSSRVLWIGSVFSTIIIAAVAGLVVYFTAFRSSTDPNAPIETTSENNPSNPSPSPILAPSPSAAATPGSAAGPVAEGATPSPSSPSSSPAESSSSSSSDDGLENASGYDHLSHAVPSGEYVAVDLNKDGEEAVQLDGSRSHTHYYSEGPPVVNGKLVSFDWFDRKTRKHLASDARPKLIFPLGETEVGLTVRDNSRDSHTAYTVIKVLDPFLKGAYCYFYPPSSSTEATIVSLAADRREEPFPTFATASSTVQFRSAASFPAEAGPDFQTRCVFSVNADTAKTHALTVEHRGPLKIFVDDKEVLSDTASPGDKKTASVSPSLTAGRHTVQLLYRSPPSGEPLLALTAGGTGITYDASEVPPVLRSIEPRQSLLEGGGDVRIEGINLLNVELEIDGVTVALDDEKSSDTSVYFVVPKASTGKVVRVRAKNMAGFSNSLQFEYQIDGKPPIKFKQSLLQTKDSGAFQVQMITGIKYGPDHRYYVSAIDNRVHSFQTDSNLVVDDICHGAVLGVNMSILGMAFNPMDTDTTTPNGDIKLYVAGSVLHWRVKKKLDHPMAWANGEIFIVKKNVGGSCLGKSGDSVITGLPVSNHDHGVNGLEFDNDGNLRIQVGGFTNAGVNHISPAAPGTPANEIVGKLGGVPANPLSGASLIAYLSRPGFDGRITYNDTDPFWAEQTGGDVDVYSSGFRNSFGIALHSNGHVYATDNGASVDFGVKSLSCTTEEPLKNGNLADELIRVIRGKYAGHPNRNRGRKDARQCQFRGPKEASDDFYEGPVATFESSTDGIIEYTANTFEGQMKGDLLCSKFTTDKSEGKVYRVQLNDAGLALSTPGELWGASGLTIVMSPYGDLLMPRVFKRQVLVLRPEPRKDADSKPEFRAVVPFRGPSAGGNWVLVTGERLADGATATFDGRPCSETQAVAADKRSFLCKVPAAGSKGAKVKVGLKFSDSNLDIDPEDGSFVDYMYMNL